MIKCLRVCTWVSEVSIVLAPRWNDYTSKYQMLIIAGLAERVFSAAPVASSSPSAIANHINLIDFKPLKCLHLSAARKTSRAHFTREAFYFLRRRSITHTSHHQAVTRWLYSFCGWSFTAAAVAVTATNTTAFFSLHEIFCFRFVYYYLQFELVLQWLNTSAAWLSARPAIFIFCWNVYSLWTHFFRCQFSIIHIDLSAQCTASPMWSIFSFTLRHIHLGHSILLFKVQQCKDYVVGIRIFAFIHSFIFVHCKRNYSCFSVPRHGYRFSHPPSSHHLRAFT